MSLRVITLATKPVDLNVIPAMPVAEGQTDFCRLYTHIPQFIIKRKLTTQLSDDLSFSFLAFL